MSKNDPDSLPPENFDPKYETDVMAYWHVIPNYRVGPKWYSKKRYALIYGPKMAVHIVNRDDPASPLVDVGSTADPLDWKLLMPEYLKWRHRYKQLHGVHAVQSNFMAYGPGGHFLNYGRQPTGPVNRKFPIPMSPGHGYVSTPPDGYDPTDQTVFGSNALK